MQQEKFEIWGIVELFGHQRIAGKLTEQNVAGNNMLRVDVPESESNPSFTRFLNHAAIYAINPTTEEVARLSAKGLNAAPIDSWDIRQFSEKLMLKVASKPEKIDVFENEGEFEEDDDN